MFLNATERRMTRGSPQMGCLFGFFESCEFSNIALKRMEPGYTWEYMLHERNKFGHIAANMNNIGMKIKAIKAIRK